MASPIRAVATLPPLLADDPSLTEAPLRVFEPAPLHTKYQKRLDALGLHYKAQRSADCERAVIWYNASEDKSNKSDTWRAPLFTSMLRSEPYKAKQLAREYENTYSPFIELIPGEMFSTLQIRFYESDPVKAQALTKEIRKLLNKHLPKTIEKPGYLNDPRYNYVLKLIHNEAVSAQRLAEIQAILPASVNITRSNAPREEFKKELAILCAPDLPRTEEGRADFEAYLDGMQSLVVHKVSKADRSKFAYTSDYVYANPLNDDGTTALNDDVSDLAYCEYHKKEHTTRIPRSPKTGHYARWSSVVVSADTKFEEIHPAEWRELPLPARKH